MIVIKNKASIEKMRVAGQKLASVLNSVNDLIRPGVSTYEIDAFIESEMRKIGLNPECKGYGTYKHATCISLNDVIVHGVPSKKIVLKNGDFVKIDVVGSYKKYCADMARYFFVGDVSPATRKIAAVAQDALEKAIEIIQPGKHLSDVSACIQKVVEDAGFSVVRHFVGHGIGKKMHEPPEIPNFGRPGRGPILREGMTLAIEPMIAENSAEVRILDDGWTAKTVDGGLAGHVEDTILVSSHGAEILTRIP